ncbi:DUF4031 domain-containing protein [Phycicoccus sonneratiae]|uniref:DUF4031 domain-containing protein n=1 Tax=Phycicoccus sonneratiae TaxID=2807628 RepID=A0ABS2CQR5_9MICO|nr:DUF4031 domain-containing protein [Phycicoccus sonneraticus]MBM6402230.1 DUF4031 domain-containing protein [Phycicoccus sonneraticus]
MAILIDPPRAEAHGRRWSHLVSDTDLDELHAFARGCGIPARGFEGDHYDVPEERYGAVVAAGAEPVPARDLLRRLVASGLRMQKRRGDKGVARVRGVHLPDGLVVDVDLIASARDADPERVFAALVLVHDAAGDLAVVRSVWRDEWGAPGGGREPGESVRENAVREVEEETGLVLDGPALQPVGYERFRPVEGRGPWSDGHDLLQLFEVHLATTRPALTSAHDDTSDRRWVTRDELERLCGTTFWWPLVERVLSPPAW